jgi:putative two-component system response regulator
MGTTEESKKIILAVDDMTMNLRTVKVALEKYFDVRLAKSGILALAVLNAAKVDLVLLDIEMPDISGFDLIERIRQLPNGKDVPIIFVSSHAYPEFVAHASKAGVKDYVTKPFDPDVLAKKVFAVLKIRDILVDKNGDCTIIPIN